MLKHSLCMMGALIALTLCMSNAALAQDAAQNITGMSKETAFILNSFMFLICGVLVMWMGAGFAMLEAGLVRSRNTATICLKNIAIFALAGMAYYVIGYNIMYVGVPEGGFWGSFTLFYSASADELALLSAGDDTLQAATETVVESADYSVMSDWFFQMVFVATAASIISGTVAERMKLWPFLAFVIVMAAVIYPIQGAWSWGGGWLNSISGGFKDFAGSTIVHSVGGWAALTGAIILGPRMGKYKGGKVNPIPGSNLPLATLGTFILWMGWFGFNGGSVLALNSAKAVTLMSVVFANTNLAAAAGCVAAMAYATLRFGKPDLTIVLNGALAGLVAITAGPDVANPGIAMLIGAVGGVLCSMAIPFFDKLRIDDVVGAISVHLVSGIWGTLAVAIFSSGDYLAQITGIVATAIYVSTISSVVWLALKYTIGLRVDARDERYGIDITEVGLEAYPEFEARGA